MSSRAGRHSPWLSVLILALVGVLGAPTALASSGPRGAGLSLRVGSAGAPLLQANPNFTVSKTGSANPVAVGANLTYTVTVTNIMGGNLSQVVITDVLPAGVSFVAATPSQGACSTLPPMGGTGTVICELGGVGTSATLTLVVQPTAAVAGTMITNTAVVTTNNAGTGSATTTTQVLAPTATATATRTATATVTPLVPPHFAPAVDFPAGNTPRSVAAADVNGDGKPDLL